MISEFIDKNHSLFGVTSCLIGILNLIYFGILVYDNEIFLKPAFGLLPDGSFMAGFIFFPLFYLIIPAIGNGIGFLSGMIGMFQIPKNKRLFVILGLIINAIIPVIFLLGFLVLIVRNQ